MTNPWWKSWARIQFRVQIYLVFFALICYRNLLDVSLVLSSRYYSIIRIWICDILKMKIILAMRRDTDFDLPIKFLALLDPSSYSNYLSFRLYFWMLHIFSRLFFVKYFVNYDLSSECWRRCVIRHWALWFNHGGRDYEHDWLLGTD